jgi:hypothetical protein
MKHIKKFNESFLKNLFKKKGTYGDWRDGWEVDNSPETEEYLDQAAKGKDEEIGQEIYGSMSKEGIKRSEGDSFVIQIDNYNFLLKKVGKWWEIFMIPEKGESHKLHISDFIRTSILSKARELLKEPEVDFDKIKGEFKNRNKKTK